MAPGIAIAGTRCVFVSGTDILDSREKFSRGERLCDAGSGAVPESDRRHFELLKAGHDNHRRGAVARGNRFQNCHAVDAGIDIDNDEIDLRQAVSEKGKGALRLGGLQQGETRTGHSLRNSRVRVGRLFRYQQRICFHAISRAASGRGRSTSLVNCRSKIAVARNSADINQFKKNCAFSQNRAIALVSPFSSFLNGPSAFNELVSDIG